MRIILLFLFAIQAYSETFLGPSSLTNRLEIETGEVLIFRTWFASRTGPTYGEWRVGDEKIPLWDHGTNPGQVSDPSLWAGPGELVFNSPVLVTFDRIKMDNVTTFYTGKTNQTFVIPSNKRLIVWAAVPEFGGSAQFTFSNPSGQIIYGQVLGTRKTASVFDGPGTLVILSRTSGSFFTVTQSSRDAAMTHGIVPSGSSTLMLLESSDLKNWTPIGVISGRADPAKFYRIVGGE